jgi:hypothetical protein
MKTKNWIRLVLVGTAILAMSGCNGGELTRSAAPVELLMTVTSQPIQQFDLAVPNDTTCQGNIVQYTITSRVKNPSPTAGAQFTDVHLTSYQVVYTRTDGGTQVPPIYVRTMDMLVAPGGSPSAVTFHITDFHTIFDQAPFVALQPINGGVDPETRKPRVKFNITLTVFGQTLGGDKVSASSTFPLDFCYNCGGCQS